MTNPPPALIAADAAPRTRPSNYPEPFASRMDGRLKRPLGELFGLKSFGVNLARLSPGAVSALHHQHSRQDEFIFVVEGEPTFNQLLSSSPSPRSDLFVPSWARARQIVRQGLVKEMTMPRSRWPAPTLKSPADAATLKYPRLEGNAAVINVGLADAGTLDGICGRLVLRACHASQDAVATRLARACEV